MTTRRIRGAAVVAAAVTGVAACSAAGGGSGGGSGGGAADPVVIGVASEPDTLSPLLGYGKDGNSKIFDGLLARDADLTLPDGPLGRGAPAVMG